MTDREDRKRRGIQGAARELRREVERGGGQITQERAERRVRSAKLDAERRRNE
jgi:hypothetical protein